MQKKHFFLWPESKVFLAIRFLFKRTPVSEIENKFQKMFPSGHPVLCSSGRACLYIALKETGIQRNNFIGLFPFASFCVIDSAGRVGSILSGDASFKADIRIVYHQWGYPQEFNLPLNSIEDCVDSLCEIGTELFPGGGAFEIWSLPKILGTTSGGLLWCKDADTAKRIRRARDNGRAGFFQWVLRLMTIKFPFLYDRWQGAEACYRKVSLFQTGEIFKAISKWDEFVKDRYAKMQIVWPEAVNWLSKPIRRLPSVIPVETTLNDEKIFEIGLTAGYRTIERVNNDGSRELIKVLPIPIHQDVSEEWLEMVVKNLHMHKSNRVW